MDYVIKSGETKDNGDFYYDGNNGWTPSLKLAFKARDLNEAISILDRLGVSGFIHSVEVCITDTVHVKYKPRLK